MGALSHANVAAFFPNPYSFEMFGRTEKSLALTPGRGIGVERLKPRRKALPEQFAL
jgi:hypothetical protein